jgi:hypothetical protein
MPHPRHVVVDVRDLTLHDAAGGEVPLGSLPGVRLLVLLRHRH